MRYLFLIAFILPEILFAQTNYEDVVYLKNGSEIHGIIIENIPNVSIKIKNNCGDVFLYKPNEIDKTAHVAKEQSPQSKGPTDPHFYQELKKWDKLLRKRLITKEEYEVQKRRILGD